MERMTRGRGQLHKASKGPNSKTKKEVKGRRRERERERKERRKGRDTGE